MDSITFNKETYINLLRLLISESKFLQNGEEHVAEETRVADHVMNTLKPHIDSGKITCEKVEYVDKRANLILKYGDSESGQSISIAGSHFDVVPADPIEWERDPFELHVDGDILYGRGTTDCLGHVALVTHLLDELAKNNVQLNYLLVVVFIADEEVGKDKNIGVLHLEEDGHLDCIKNGPVFWLDASDVNPVIASGTGMAWVLKVTGKKAHSGYPHLGINPIPIAMEASKAIVTKFNELCPRTQQDTDYNFRCSSNMKPTMWEMASGSSPNQYADWVSITGDVRMTPFYDAYYIKDEMLKFTKELNVHNLPKWHECMDTVCGEGDQRVEAIIDFQWVFGPYCGIACDTSSKGYELITAATSKHHGSCKGSSGLGAIPLVKEMQDSGIDVQIIGYGATEAYHSNNEYCTLSGMEKGFNILKTLFEFSEKEYNSDNKKNNKSAEEEFFV
jgi:acetylornithine deacetylase